MGAQRKNKDGEALSKIRDYDNHCANSGRRNKRGRIGFANLPFFEEQSGGGGGKDLSGVHSMGKKRLRIGPWVR